MGDRFADEERAALLALLDERPPMLGERAGKTSWSTIASEVSLRGSALAVWQDIHPPLLTLALDGDLSRDESELQFQVAWKQLIEWESSKDFDLLTVLDEEYPFALRGIHQMPPMLFVKGVLRPDERGVSVVGSRRATRRGLSIAANVAEGLAERGISVISGLADGIDGAAHEATLRAGGRPIGVIGTGINRVYPAIHRELHDRVAAAGALVSQFFPDAPPTKQSFPMRNVTMSGLGRASIIVEASEHSGTRIQARVAVEHGRPVILTDIVVNATKWGREMRDRPGVYVAGSTAEVMDIVKQVVNQDEDDSLGVLAPLAGLPDGR
ncbi:DNA-protecting protein DprA [Mycolicibacterium smegmatis]|uniref:DNA-processing protein DprA n=1 Tax=Mycolicibacterium smegmatis TaxID=1772 RepID=UPI0009BFE901|nr:DNA-processing protein DprA [Mycolicibacterium smegmatis]MDF1899789.1 DNA-protecting protein DprA [Mycolicibacterium smegmatis]MDF1905577.1 DNA-protecting protein DprA [Mycolicibacterium smegmatis]MDF1917824.1 DNA-protecting protein DprA [Mycolicibacterium smegmatis]MDF1924620.1 DNA-protecting protein DprA [Mycolicibacterium smegmatis]UAK57653.1 DNA-protecting protein DprA [Mycolicibacterium smegmatis]